MSIRVLVLLIGLVGAADSCSCGGIRYSSVVCNDRVKYIIKVKITSIVEKEKEEETVIPDYQENSTATSSSPMTSTHPWGGVRKVKAVISHFYKGKGKVGTATTLSSDMMDSMCGMGGWLLPGRIFVLATNDLSHSELGLCSFNFMVGGWEWETLEPILKNHDCGCKLSECKLREGRRVLRGMCHDPDSYCTRDKKGSCRWKNAQSIDSCRRARYYYPYS